VTTMHRKPIRRSIAVLAALACAGLLAAAPAQAGNEFQDGFEDQMGRLVALQVFQLGNLLIFGPPATYVYTETRYTPPPPLKKHHRKHRGHRGHCRGKRCNHGHEYSAHRGSHGYAERGYVEEVERSVVRRRRY